jgi:2-succinyl-5-enolpyruvyl-6-hydroxy-3-cyclohexene-1-carboxylate synthase
VSEPNQATAFSVAILGEFIRRGVRDIVLSPGSRSQSLALAAEAWERRGMVRLQVRIDERSAGFLALGLAVESATPVILITTSGTAVANLHPAALEAHHSGVPLILLTADRPPELRGIGSNQTTEQLGIFGSAVGWLREVEAPNDSGFDADYPGQLAHEAYSAAAGHSSRPGPVQLNLAFREPLSGRIDRLPELVQHEWQGGGADRAGSELGHAEHAVVIAGHGAGPRAEELARALGVPLLAEVSSGSHFGPNLVIAYRELLRDAEFGGRVRRAIVFGHPTLSREVPALLQRAGVEVHIVRGSAVEAYNPGRRATRISEAVHYVGEPDRSPGGRAWLGSWVHTSRSLHEHDGQPEHEHEHGHHPAATTPDAEHAGDFAREQLAVFRQPVTRRMLVQSVWQSTWPHDRLVFGASRLIRVADGILPGKKITVHSNRGLAGIDGTIATSVGIALASQRSDGAVGVTRVLLGDLAALHDVGSLLFGVGETRPRIQVIVGNDGGGTIFDDLEVAASAPSDAFDRVLYTPQDVDFAALASAYGWAHRLVTNRGELDEALSATDGQSLIEVRLPR